MGERASGKPDWALVAECDRVFPPSHHGIRKVLDHAGIKKEDLDGLDNFRGFARFVVSRARHFLHDGRLHPDLVGLGDGCRPVPCPPGPKTDCLIVEKNK